MDTMGRKLKTVLVGGVALPALALLMQHLGLEADTTKEVVGWLAGLLGVAIGGHAITDAAAARGGAAKGKE